ncbi:MAG: cupin domain-containing protein [Alphaproteobacteria bacterium]|nr:cupin domain-containing protein [Alphaproteobacteria bacterium]
MRTIDISAEEMKSRVSRFRELKPLRAAESLDIPQEAKDVIYSRELLSVIGLEDSDTPVNQGAPIVGAGGITMTHAKCPPGTGPSLHAHQQTYETFTVMKGRFEVRWNDDGEQRVELEELDTISVPPGVCRAFRNIGDEDGILQVIISGGVHDMNDIDFPKATAEQLASYGEDVVRQFEERGMTFTAGKDAC